MTLSDKNNTITYTKWGLKKKKLHNLKVYEYILLCFNEFKRIHIYVNTYSSLHRLINILLKIIKGSELRVRLVLRKLIICLKMYFKFTDRYISWYVMQTIETLTSFYCRINTIPPPQIKVINPIWASQQCNLNPQQLSQRALNDTLVTGMATSSL